MNILSKVNQKNKRKVNRIGGIIIDQKIVFGFHLECILLKLYKEKIKIYYKNNIYF